MSNLLSALSTCALACAGGAAVLQLTSGVVAWLLGVYRGDIVRDSLESALVLGMLAKLLKSLF
jgi:hypothetical protein